MPPAGFADAKVSGVSCLGRCNEAPAVSINEHIYTGLSQNEITAIVAMYWWDAHRRNLHNRTAVRTVHPIPMKKVSNIKL